MPYFSRSVGRVKIRTTSKNSQPYTTKYLMRELLSNVPNCCVCAGEFCSYLFTGNARQNYAKLNRIDTWNPAKWLVNSRRTRKTGSCGFDQAITGTFHNVKISSFDGPNYTSIQVFHFKISVQKKCRKEIRIDEQNFFRNFNPIHHLRVVGKLV